MAKVMIYKKLTLRCWKCKKTYSHYEEVDAEKKLKVTCPHCGAEAVVDFAPYRKEKKIVMRSASSGKKTVISYDLPETLETNEF